jgi:hypothetical protein
MHQRLTQYNNPFQILTDNDNDIDDDTIIASNYSLPAPLPSQHNPRVPNATPTTNLRPPTQGPKQTLVLYQQPRPPPTVIPLSQPQTTPPQPQSPNLLQTLLICPPSIPTMIPHDLRPPTNRKWMRPPTTSAAAPSNNIIEPDNECCDCSTPRLPTTLCCSTCFINTLLPGNISIQAVHHIMTLETIKVDTDLQWTGAIIDIQEACCGIVHPITKVTITQYKKLQPIPTPNIYGSRQ